MIEEIRRQLSHMNSGEWSMSVKHMQALLDEIDALRTERDRLRAEIETLKEHYRAAEKESGDLFEEVEKAEAERDKLLALISDVCLDHSCGLEGWDEACAECNLMKHLRADA